MVEAGWYQDPKEPELARWHDGTGWTGSTLVIAEQTPGWVPPALGEGEGPEASPGTFLESLGVRATRRAEPRASISLAGAGCALAVIGILLLSGDTGADSGGDSFDQAPGVILSALVVVSGLVLLSRKPRGPLATASAVAIVLGTPPLLLFLTFDDTSLPPWSTEAILVVSTLVWLGAYVVGPGRGRPIFLGAALLGAWASVLQVSEKVFDLPFTVAGAVAVGFDEAFSSADGVGGSSGLGAPDLPDPATVGLLSLVIGLVYLVVSRRLDLSGHRGTATPFVVAGIPALAAGAMFLGDELGGVATGGLLALIGIGLALHGGSVARRGTTWIGGLFSAVGLLVSVLEIADGDGTVAGVLAVVLGLGLVGGAHALARHFDEPDELDPTPDPPLRLLARRTTAPAGGPAPQSPT